MSISQDLTGFILHKRHSFLVSFNTFNTNLSGLDSVSFTEDAEEISLGCLFCGSSASINETLSRSKILRSKK